MTVISNTQFTARSKFAGNAPLLAIATALAFLISISFASSVMAQTDDLGLEFGASYEAGYQAAPWGSDAGGSNKQRLTLNLSADTGKLFGLENGTFFFQYQNHTGEHGRDNVGDIQQFDGLDDPEYDRIHMFWYQHVFMDGKLRIKLGKVEPKSEFFAPENAKNHLGFSTERSPTIIAQGPPSMSINAFYSPTDNFTIAFGIYDATWNQGRDENTFKLYNFFEADEYAIFVEGRYKWQTDNSGRGGGVKVGFWRLDGERNLFAGGQVDGTNGYYIVLDQTITDNGIGVYAQFGSADKKVSALSRHIGAGMQWVGPFNGRDNDVFGAGVSTVKFSNAPGSPFIKASETAYEIFYKAPITSWFTVQADGQLITNPGGLGAESVFVSTFRGTVAF